MSKNRDVIACFKKAFAKNQNGNQPVLSATLASYNMLVPQVLLILNMTSDCLKPKWLYTVPGSVDTTQTIQALIASIMNNTTPMPAMAGFTLRQPANKNRKAAKPPSKKKKAATPSNKKKKKKAAKLSKRKSKSR